MRNGVLRPVLLGIGALVLLAGCATYRQPAYPGKPAAQRRAPAKPAGQAARSAPPIASAPARAAAAERLPTSEPAEEGSRSAIPLAGFRPMRGQGRHNP